MGSYAEALQEFYSGEVLGEALYSALLAASASESEGLKMAALLQLETETKARLRPYLLAAGVSVVEEAADRDKGQALAAYFGSLPWGERLEGLRTLVLDQVVPRYRKFADAARARERADEEALCLGMVEHELAQVEFFSHELAGDENPLVSIERLLKFPISI